MTTDPAPAAPAVPPEVAPRQARVLIVDDTSLARRLLRRALSASGRFDVIGEATNGRDGIEQATLHQPDIIVLDLAMPVMDGLEAVPHLARCSPRSLIIMLSGFNVGTAGARAIALGAHVYIDKKHRPAEVLRQIVDAWDSTVADRRD